MLVNSTIILNGTDISNKVISYKRESNICTGVGNLTLVTVDSLSPDPWNTVIIYENSSKVGTYYIYDEDRGIKSGTKTIKCQDGSKKMQSYFIDDSYSYNYITTSRYWIERLLDEAGVSYNITASDDGSTLAPDTPFGMSNVYELVYSLLQISGWYMYFDQNNVCVIGKLFGGSSVATFDDTEILEFSESINDRMSRNRVIVWGNNDPVENRNVFADIYEPASWQIDSSDIRTIVLANDKIRSYSVAQSIAEDVLDEFNSLTHEKTVKLAGFHDLKIGDEITLNSQYSTGKSTITTLETDASSKGMITTLILDQRCPRIIGYYSGIIYVYIGTSSMGVWRKELDGSMWYSFSLGLNDMDIQDLIIKNSVMACVAGNRAYVNIGHTIDNWLEYVITELSDGIITYTTEQLKVVACDIDDTTGNIFFGIITDTEHESLPEQRSWVMEITSSRILVDISLIYVTDETDLKYKLIDVGKFNNNTLATVEGPANLLDFGSLFGDRQDNPQHTSANPEALAYGLLPTTDTSLNIDTNILSVGYFSIINGDHVTAASSTNVTFAMYDKSTGKYTNIIKYLNNPTAGMTTVGSGYGNVFISDTFHPENLKMAYASATSLKCIVYWTFSPLVSGFDGLPKLLVQVRGVTTSEITLYGEQTIDGRSIVAGNRVLVKDQSNKVDNGIWICQTTEWTRATDVLEFGCIFPKYEPVLTGYTERRFFQLSTPGDIIVGTTPIDFEEVLKQSYVKLDNKFLDYTYVVAKNRGETAYFKAYTSTDIGVTIFDLSSGNILSENPLELLDGNFVALSGMNNIRDMEDCGFGIAIIDSKSVPRIEDVDGISTTFKDHITRVFTINRSGVTYKDIQIFTETAEVPGYWDYYGGGEGAPVSRVFAVAQGEANTNFIDEISVPSEYGTTDIYSSAVCVSGTLKNTGNYVNFYLMIITRSNQTSKQDKYNPPHSIPDYGYIGRITWIGAVYKFPSGIRVDYVSPTSMLGHTLDTSKPWTIDYESYNLILKEFWELDDCYPLISKTHPYFIRNYGGSFGFYKPHFYESSRFQSKLGYLNHECGWTYQTDDFDNSIYLMDLNDTKAFHKIAPNIGTIISTYYRLTARTVTTMSYLGGYLLTGIYLSRVRDDVLLKDAAMCHILNKLPDGDDKTGFEIIDSDFYRLKTEMSSSDNFVSWTLSGLLIDYVASGISISGIIPSMHEHLNIYDTNFNKTQLSGSFTDARVFPLNGYVYSNGVYLVVSDGNYVGYLTRSPESEFNIVNVDDITESYNITTYSGAVMSGSSLGRLEVSNISYPQYMFVSLSGMEGEVIKNNFYQRNPGASVFSDYSNTLPESDITVIRLDDTL